MIFLNPEKSVVVTGVTGAGKTTYLTKLVSVLAKSKSVCVIEPLNKVIYHEVAKIGSFEIASFNQNTVEEIRNSKAAVDFIHLPLPSRSRANQNEAKPAKPIFKLALIHQLLMAYDAIIIDETYHTMSELIHADLFTEFLLACQSEGILVVFSGQKPFLNKIIPAGKENLLDYVLEIEVEVQQNGHRKNRLHDAGLYYEKLTPSAQPKRNFGGSSLGSSVHAVAGMAIGSMKPPPNHANSSDGKNVAENGETKESFKREDFIMDMMKFVAELLVWASNQSNTVKTQTNSIIDKALDEFEKIAEDQKNTHGFDILLQCFEEQAKSEENTLHFQQFLKDLEPLFKSKK